MKKKLLILLCSLLLGVSLVGCGSDGSNESENLSTVTIGGREFIVISDYPYIDEGSRLYVDVETKIQYLFIDSGYEGGLTVLVDAEGKPILYEGVIE